MERLEPAGLPPRFRYSADDSSPGRSARSRARRIDLPRDIDSPPRRSAAGRLGPDAAELEAWFTSAASRVPRPPGRRRGLGREREPLPTPARCRLRSARQVDAAFRFDTVADTEIRLADGGLTEKALHRLSDGALVESVLMHYPARGAQRERHTLCISSQAGCAVGCPFCATGELGFHRDLETAEIVDQVRAAARRRGRRRRLTERRVHGHGRAAAEPRPGARGGRRPQRQAPVRARRRAHHGLDQRRRAGHPPLTALGAQFTLAISLHAARDPLRDVLVPLNRRWPVAEVVDAARDHARATGRRVSYETTMISGVNDTQVDAEAMADLLRGDHAHVNLIPMNPVAHTPWVASPNEVIERFAATLKAAGIATTIRRNDAARRSARRAASSRPSGRGAAGGRGRSAPRAADRRERPRPRGERSTEPAPARLAPARRGGGH